MATKISWNIQVCLLLLCRKKSQSKTVAVYSYYNMTWVYLTINKNKKLCSGSNLVSGMVMVRENHWKSVLFWINKKKKKLKTESIYVENNKKNLKVNDGRSRRKKNDRKIGKFVYLNFLFKRFTESLK